MTYVSNLVQPRDLRKRAKGGRGTGHWSQQSTREGQRGGKREDARRQSNRMPGQLTWYLNASYVPYMAPARGESRFFFRGRSRSASEREGNDERVRETHRETKRERENRVAGGTGLPNSRGGTPGARGRPGEPGERTPSSAPLAPHGATSKHSPMAPPRLPPTVAPVATFLIHRESIALDPSDPLHRFTNVPPRFCLACFFSPSFSCSVHIGLPSHGTGYRTREFYKERAERSSRSAIPWSTPELRGGSGGERDRRSLLTGWRDGCTRGEGEPARPRPSRATR